MLFLFTKWTRNKENCLVVDFLDKYGYVNCLFWNFATRTHSFIFSVVWKLGFAVLVGRPMA